MTVDYVGFAYAAAIAAGGVFGYVKTGSLPSLGSGLLFGAVLGFGAYLITQDSTNIYLSLGTSAVLGGIMGYRYCTTTKFMPAGLIAALSLGMVLQLSYRGINNWMVSQKTRQV